MNEKRNYVIADTQPQSTNPIIGVIVNVSNTYVGRMYFSILLIKALEAYYNTQDINISIKQINSLFEVNVTKDANLVVNNKKTIIRVYPTPIY